MSNRENHFSWIAKPEDQAISKEREQMVSECSVEKNAFGSLSKGIEEKADKKIEDAINLAIGKGWSYADLRGRIGMIRFQNDPKETLTLDGKPIMELYPVQLASEQRGRSMVVIATQDYRILSQNAESIHHHHNHENP